jgi:peptidyl-dipeptidase Dcp
MSTLTRTLAACGLVLLTGVSAPAVANALLTPSPLPLQYPPFNAITDADFAPALTAGMALQRRELAAIVGNPAPPSFENTIEALERSGRLLNRALTVLSSLNGADTNPERQRLQREFAPVLAQHRDAIALDPALFQRIDALFQQRERLGLSTEQRRLLERRHRDLLRAGVQLPPAAQARLRAINVDLSRLGADFNQKVLAEVNASAVVVATREELAGLSDAQIDALRQADGRYRLPLQNTSGQPWLAQLSHRPTRERLMQASLSRNARGDGNDTRELISQVLRLRAERAALLGHAHHADFTLQTETAGSTATVNALLAQLAPAAVAAARQEAVALQAQLQKDHPGATLQPWDWAYYAERERARAYGYDEAQLRPYLALDNVLQRGVFEAATRLFGLRFKRRPDLPVYHPDVQAWEVIGPHGRTQGFLLLDLYARPSKRGGAWANAYVGQSHLLGTQPVVGNHMNIPKPPAGQPTLLTWTEVETLFHEFGHNLHTLLSDVRYPSLAGTAVPRDFVEFPSQVNEMWQTWPSILANYARHHQTGEPMPKALIDKVEAAKRFNQGFATSEYLAATLIDLHLHQLRADQIPSADALMNTEAQVLQQHGFDTIPVPPRYRTPYFSHIMGGYAAGYYAYLWSEVLDANTVEWIEQHGGLNRATGERMKRFLLERGGSEDPMALFKQLVGHEPRLEPYLRRRGLTLGTR